MKKLKDYQPQAQVYAEIGHDLRQPLQAIKILLSMLKEETQTLSQFELLSRVENAFFYLESGVENLLATARFENNHLKATHKKTNLSQILKTIAEEYKLIAVYKNLELTYGGTEIVAKTDEILLERIIRNLLHNALKYGRGKIKMRWYALPNKVRIFIKDNGLGLKKEECKQLFRAYYRCSRDKNKSQGCGLGLAIVKELAETLGIHLNLKSKWKKGTIFILTLKR